jgi:hypothetical protein
VPARPTADETPGEAPGADRSLLDRHLRHDDRDRPHARVDLGPDVQLVLTAPTVSFVPRTREVHTGWITCVLCPRLVVRGARW